jgi:hypothetical protein
MLACIPARADIALPPDGFAKPDEAQVESAPRLFVKLVDDGQGPRLVIPQDALAKLKAGAPAEGSSGLGGAAWQAIVGGLALAVAAAVGGAIALRRRFKPLPTLAGATCVILACALAARADLLPFAPADRPANERPDPNRVDIGEVTLELSPDAQEVTLIVDRSAIGPLVRAAVGPKGGATRRPARRAR